MNLSIAGNSCLIGEANTGKTSILFQMAYDVASQGGNPLFICNKIRIESKLPCPMNKKGCIDQKNWSPSILLRIGMKYVSSAQELKAVCAGLFAFVPLPTVVFIDNLTNILDPLNAIGRGDPKFLEMVLGVTTFAVDSLAHLQHSSGLQTTTSSKKDLLLHQLQHAGTLVVADDCRDPLFLHCMKRCCPNLLQLRRMSSNGGGLRIVRHSMETSANGPQVESVIELIEYSNGRIFY